MIVRRFMSWLRMTVAATLGGARLRAGDRNVREPVLVGAPPKGVVIEQGTPGVATGASLGTSLSSWLDNGRRLRPRLRLTPPPREPGKAITRPLRYRPHPAPAPTVPSGEAPPPRAGFAPIGAGSPDGPQAIPAMPTTPLFPARETHDAQNAGQSDDHNDDLTDLEQLDADTRRLMVLRHLVRKRVFNEGFAASDTPRQYHHSLGMDEAPPDA